MLNFHMNFFSKEKIFFLGFTYIISKGQINQRQSCANKAAPLFVMPLPIFGDCLIDL